MAKSLYSKLCDKALSLRERLAVTRTIFASERTFLAYVRTALTFLVAGITFIRFFGLLLVEVLGWIFVFVGIIIFIIGIISFRRMRKFIGSEETENKNLTCTEEES
jgi:putative membrane protein